MRIPKYICLKIQNNVIQNNKTVKVWKSQNKVMLQWIYKERYPLSVTVYLNIGYIVFYIQFNRSCAHPLNYDIQFPQYFANTCLLAWIIKMNKLLFRLSIISGKLLCWIALILFIFLLCNEMFIWKYYSRSIQTIVPMQQTWVLLLTINLIITRCKMTLQQEVHFIPTDGST